MGIHSRTFCTCVFFNTHMDPDTQTSNSQVQIYLIYFKCVSWTKWPLGTRRNSHKAMSPERVTTLHSLPIKLFSSYGLIKIQVHFTSTQVFIASSLEIPKLFLLAEISKISFNCLMRERTHLWWTCSLSVVEKYLLIRLIHQVEAKPAK